MNWQPSARVLARQVTHPVSRWHEPVAATARHQFIPRWWAPAAAAWELRDGPADPEAWLAAAYRDQTLVTRVGPQHADLAPPPGQAEGLPTSSGTLPGLVVRMYQHGQIADGMDVLDVGTGPGYGTALLCRRLGARHVTSIDIDPYLIEAAATRLVAVGHQPQLVTADATGPLPGSYDRIISMTSVRPVPVSWLAALRPGGRIVTTLTGTTAILTADLQPDGTALGRLERDWAGFMPARHGPDYPPDNRPASHHDAEPARPGRYPLVVLEDAWELRTILSLEHPGITGHHHDAPDGTTTVQLAHPDGSWATATGQRGTIPLVRQGGPQHLWDHVDHLRDQWLAHGSFPVYGAAAMIQHDGTIRLARGTWHATIT
jgi:protein-L-isoaspartate O-methyltransferase